MFAEERTERMKELEDVGWGRCGGWVEKGR